MKAEQQEFGAPWGRLLMGMSGGVVALFVWVLFMSGKTGPALVLFPLILLLALPFMVRGYVVTEKELVIKRPGWTTRFALEELKSAVVDPDAMKRSIRLCGNGPLFSFTGLYRNKKLGRYRVFVNDLNRVVVLRFAKRTIVVSPDDPEIFVEAIKDQTGNQT